MDTFLIHFLLLGWLSLGAARELTRHLIDTLLAAALLAWGNIVATGLVLSACHRLGESSWFFGTSILLALGVALAARQGPAPAITAPSASAPAGAAPNRWLLTAFLVMIVPLALGSFGTAYIYQPKNPDAFAYHLPRATYYLGQGSLAHFDAADLRQTHLPFDYNLLQLSALTYRAPLQCLNFFNLAVWALGGLAVYRVSRLIGLGGNAALIACWLILTSTCVIAQAASVTPELAVAFALLGAFLFYQQAASDQGRASALLASLALALGAGSDLRATCLGAVVGAFFLAPRFSRHRPPGLPAGWRFWLGPVLIIGFGGLSFLAINLFSGRPYFPSVHPLLDGTGAILQGFLPLLHSPAWDAGWNEDVAGFGLGGLASLCGLFFCLRQTRRPAGLLAGIALGWIMLGLVLHFSPARSRDFIPALFILGPCVAALISSMPALAPFPRHAGQAALVVVMASSGWSACLYILKNTDRPFAPLLQTSLVASGLPPLPLLVEHRMSRQTRVNVDTDAPWESIYPFLGQNRKARFTSSRTRDPGAFNLISRAAAARNAGYDDASLRGAYVLIAVPAKRTAGVEFLATVGHGDDTRDYFGIEPHAGETDPLQTNRTMLVTMDRTATPSNRPAEVRLRLAGLNPADRASVVVELVDEAGGVVPLSRFTAEGEAVVAIAGPFHVLLFRVLDDATQTEIGRAAIPYRTLTDETPALDPSRPSSASSLFVTDLVRSREIGPIEVEGLLPVEGPFPQWDLPLIRWAREPLVRLKIAPVEKLARLQLSFSLRLHVRPRGEIAVYLNHQLVHQYRLESRLDWLEETLDLQPAPGENVVEFRDASTNTEPDWADYLERYPDVKLNLIAQNLPLEPGALHHYETHGRAEGRTMNSRKVPPFDSYYFMFRKLRLEGFKAP